MLSHLALIDKYHFIQCFLRYSVTVWKTASNDSVHEWTFQVNQTESENPFDHFMNRFDCYWGLSFTNNYKPENGQILLLIFNKINCYYLKQTSAFFNVLLIMAKVNKYLLRHYTVYNVFVLRCLPFFLCLILFWWF